MSDHLNQLRRLYADRELGAAWALYDRDRGSPEPEWHLLGSLTASRVGDWSRARQAIERALTLPAEDASLHTRIQFQTGDVLRTCGEYRTALDAWDRCIDLLQDVPDLIPLLTGAAHYNRALTLWSLRRPVAAAADYQVAVVEFEREGMTAFLADALLNLAWTQADLRRADEAAEALDRAEPLCRTEEMRPHYRLNRARVQLAQGMERSEILPMLSALIDSEETPASVKCLAAVLVSEVAGQLGLLDEAEQMAKSAIYWATTSVSDSARDARCFTLAGEALRNARKRLTERGA